MSAIIRCIHRRLMVCYSIPLSSLRLAHLFSLSPRKLRSCSQSIHYFSSKVAPKPEFLEQFSPFSCFNALNTAINSNERRKLAVGITKIIIHGKECVFREFSQNFCPFNLVKIMKLLVHRQTALAFFKFVFCDHSDGVVQQCCISVHLLLAEDLRLLAQDMLTWLIQEIGEHRSYEIVWRGSHKNTSDFLILDALMRSFTKMEMGYCALEILDRMREVGGRPSVSAICILFKLLLRIGDYGSVWKLFRDMVRKGPSPSVYVYNVMILGFCKKGAIGIGESLLYVMRKFRCEPDVYTYNILISTCCNRGLTWEALGWVNVMIESGCYPSTATFSMVINVFCKKGNIVEARKIFGSMQEMNVSPNTSLYNALMDGYVKAREIGLAAMLYDEMRNMGVSPDSMTYNILAAGYYKYGKDEDGDRLLWELSSTQSVPYGSLPDLAIVGLCWAGKLDEAHEFLENMLEKGIPVSVTAFNSLIFAYGKSGFEDKAFEVYNIMLKFGVTPSASTCTSLLLGLSKTGRLQEAKALLYKMIEKGYPINKVAFTVILDGFSKKADIVSAQSIWEEMKMHGMAPDAVAFSAFVDGLSKAGFVQEAYDMFVQMKMSGVVPNNFVYNSLIYGFCNCGKLNEALKLENEMRESGLLPDIITYNVIIHGFCLEGRMKLAMDTFMKIHRHGLIPDIVTYNTLISGYCNVFDMSNVENLANSIHPDVTTYNIQIRSYCRSQRINLAVMMFDELISSGIVPDTVTYNTLMNGVCHDVLEHAMVLTGKLLKIAFVPDLVTTNLLLSNLRKQGLPQRTAMWAEKLREISFEFDEITHKILDKAYRDLQEDAECEKEITGKSLFLDFLMYMTYDFILRNRSYQETSKSYQDVFLNPFAITVNQPAMNLKRVNV